MFAPFLPMIVGGGQPNDYESCHASFLEGRHRQLSAFESRLGCIADSWETDRNRPLEDNALFTRKS
ncbi:MAG: hypothetical protein U0136_21555 [Bdellovibrionota bacterium]